MTDDLTARLERALHVQEQHETDLRPDAAALADLHARVARGRRGRTTAYAAVAAAVVGVVGVAGWFGLQHRTAPEPAGTPTPTVSPARPSPSSGPTAVTPDAASLVVVDRPGAPLLHALPPGVLESASTGWVLAGYGPVDQDPDRPGLVVLLSPTGVAYLVTDLATSDVAIVDWEPGADTALVVVPQPEGPYQQRGVLDPRTGTVTADPAGLGDVGGADSYVGRRDDGAELWWVNGPDGDLALQALLDGQVERLGVTVPSGEHRGAVLSPDRKRLALVDPSDEGDAGGAYLGDASRVVDLRTGATAEVPLDPDGGHCRAMDWVDARTLLASCVEYATVADPDDSVADVLRSWHTEASIDGDVATYASDASGEVAVGGAGSDVVVVGPLSDDGSGPSRGATTRLWVPGAGPGPVTAALDIPQSALEARRGGPSTVVATMGTSPEDPWPVELWSLDARSGAVVLIGPHGEGPAAMHAVDWIVLP